MWPKKEGQKKEGSREGRDQEEQGPPPIQLHLPIARPGGKYFSIFLSLFFVFLLFFIFGKLRYYNTITAIDYS